MNEQTVLILTFDPKDSYGYVLLKESQKNLSFWYDWELKRNGRVAQKMSSKEQFNSSILNRLSSCTISYYEDLPCY